MPIDTSAFRAELRRLLLRLVRLIQHIGDCHRAPGVSSGCAGPSSTAHLRPTYLYLLGQATRLVQVGLGVEEAEAPAYVATQLVAQLRASSGAERRQGMSLREALGQ